MSILNTAHCVPAELLWNMTQPYCHLEQIWSIIADINMCVYINMCVCCENETRSFLSSPPNFRKIYSKMSFYALSFVYLFIKRQLNLFSSFSPKNSWIFYTSSAEKDKKNQFCLDTCYFCCLPKICLWRWTRCSSVSCRFILRVAQLVFIHVFQT